MSGGPGFFPAFQYVPRGLLILRCKVNLPATLRGKAGLSAPGEKTAAEMAVTSTK